MHILKILPASILYKSIAGRYRPVSYPDGPITARYRFINNAYWAIILLKIEKTIQSYPHLPPDLALCGYLSMSRANVNGSKDVRAIEMRLH